MIDRTSLVRVVAVANGKGGVGKTTLAATLAGMAGEAGYRVLLIDLDPQGNVGEDLGYTGAGRSDDGASLADAIGAGAPLAPVLTGVRERLDVICGGDRLETLSATLMSQQSGEVLADRLARPLSALLEAAEYDLVVIDCPPGDATLQSVALGAARWLLIPTRGDAASLKGMTRIVLRLVAAREHNPALELLGVVLFGIGTSATRLRRDIQNQIRAALGGAAPLFETTIRNSVAATDARAQGLLIQEHAAAAQGEPFWQALKAGRRPTSPGSSPALAADYAALSHEILLRIATSEAAESSMGDQPETQGETA